MSLSKEIHIIAKSKIHYQAVSEYLQTAFNFDLKISKSSVENINNRDLFIIFINNQKDFDEHKDNGSDNIYYILNELQEIKYISSINIFKVSELDSLVNRIQHPFSIK